MLAMQYSIPLPHDYHAEQIRARVSERKALFDDHAGLLHKSFIYSEKDHIYAPFYIWKDVSEAKEFLLDDLFKGVVSTFSRHRVRSWIVVSMRYGNRASVPTYARREIDPLPPEESLSIWSTHEKEQQEALITNHPGLYLHVVALDADRWEVLRYSLWESAAAAPKAATDCYQSYDLLHVSEPGLVG